MSRPRSGWSVLAASALAASALAALVVVAFAEGWIEVPDRWNPWAPLRPEEPPTLWTPYKLSRLSRDPESCMATLAETTLSYSPVPDRSLAGGCGWSNAVRVSALPERVTAPFVLSCPAAVSLAIWKRHALQPVAAATLGERVVALEHLGSYACRDIGGGAVRGRRRRRASQRARDRERAGRRCVRARRRPKDQRRPGLAAAGRRPAPALPAGHPRAGLRHLQRRARPRVQPGAPRSLPSRSGPLSCLPMKFAGSAPTWPARMPGRRSSLHGMGIAQDPYLTFAGVHHEHAHQTARRRRRRRVGRRRRGANHLRLGAQRAPR